MRLSVASLRRMVKRRLHVEFTHQALISSSGLELAPLPATARPAAAAAGCVCHDGQDCGGGPAAAGRDAARSRGDPKTSRAPGDGPLRAEPRPRPARSLIGSARAQWPPSCLRREASFLLIRAVHLPLFICRLTAALCAPSILLTVGRARSARPEADARCACGSSRGRGAGLGRDGLGTGARGRGGR